MTANEMQMRSVTIPSKREAVMRCRFERDVAEHVASGLYRGRLSMHTAVHCVFDEFSKLAIYVDAVEQE